jgi:hypothetical protein
MEMREGMGQRLTNYGELLRDGKAKIWQLFVIWSSNILVLSMMKFIQQQKNASCTIDVISTCLSLLYPYHFLLIKS